MQNITKPARIVDLHTHLFNARCMPIAGIIANLFGRDAKSSLFARVSADLINKLTQSEDEPDLAFGASSLKDGDEGDYADRVVMITLERLGLVRTDVAFVAGPIGRPSLTQLTAAELAVIASSEIVELVKAVESAITELESEIGDSIENGRLADSLSIAESFDSGDQLAVTKSIGKVILNQLRRCEAKARSLAHEIGDFSQFCFSMLTSINTQYSTLKKRYGDIEPKLMIVHHMMDMENAYVVNGTSRKEIRLKYDYPTQQTAILSDLGKKNNDKLIGFAAFDPRRSDWEDIANRAIDEQGFTGFKFYPAMGYLPIGTTNIDRTDTVPQSIVAQRVKDFFFWCVKNDKPVFTHCTPVGFETRL